MPFTYPHRHLLKAEIVARVAAGERVVEICAEAGMPCEGSVQVWRRGDPGFAAELALAQVRGDARRRLAFDEAKAAAFIARVAAGARVRNLLGRPGMPSQRTYRHWRLTEARFQEALWRLKGVRDRARGARLRGRFRAFDQDVADKVLVRVARGGVLRKVLAADPALPCLAVVKRWREEDPEWGRALRIAFGAGRRIRGHPRALRTLELTEEITGRIVEGESLRSLAREPGMPAARTLYSWVAKSAEFAEDVGRACDMREYWYADQMAEIGEAVVPGNAAAMRGALSSLVRQSARLQNRPGRKWRRL